LFDIDLVASAAQNPNPDHRKFSARHLNPNAHPSSFLEVFACLDYGFAPERWQAGRHPALPSFYKQYRPHVVSLFDAT
jgi:hypothetical protein